MNRPRPLMRLASDFVVAALVRRAETAGAYAVVARKGDPSAGAIYVLVDSLSGRVVLYAPAPAYRVPERMPDEAALTGNRLFVPVPLEPEADRARAEAYIASEARLDADLWLVEIEDRAMRSFLPVLAPET